MPDQPPLCAIVLAAGEGRRLQGITTTRSGEVIPKQFCSFLSDRSLLSETIDRAHRAGVAAEHVVPVVQGSHRRWWRPQLSELDPEQVVVQPAEKGTAVGLLLPLFHILCKTSEAVVLVLPSDHFVVDEPTMLEAMAGAVEVARRKPQRVVLLGVAPDSSDAQYGWIVPRHRLPDGTFTVDRFVEKPPAATAVRLREAGAVWNSFIMVGRLRAFLGLFVRALPQIVRPLLPLLPELEAQRWGALEHVYDGLPRADFSTDVLEQSSSSLLLYRVPECGWTDLGTPRRLARCALSCSRSLPLEPIAPDQERPLELSRSRPGP